MRIRAFFILPSLALLGLAACQPQGLSITETPEQAIAITGCGAKTERSWIVDAQRSFTIEALTVGPDCPKAAVTLVVRAPDGVPALVWAAPTKDVFGLYDVTEAAAMEAALADWIDQSHSQFRTANALPAWAEGAQGPGAANAEFPFHAESWFDRPTWEQMRAENAAVFAFAQGHESQAVYILRDGMLEAIGVQQFPG